MKKQSPASWFLLAVWLSLSLWCLFEGKTGVWKVADVGDLLEAVASESHEWFFVAFLLATINHHGRTAKCANSNRFVCVRFEFVFGLLGVGECPRLLYL